MPRPSRSQCVLVVATLVIALLPGVAFGQRRRQGGASLPQPQLQSLFPAGVVVGENVDVSIRGADLEGPASLWFDHPGLRALHLKDQTFRIVAAPGTPVGHHDVRVIGRYGISNPRTFVVGDRPESRESEPNNTAAQASSIVINSVVNGEIDPAADIDHFAFDAKKGQRLFIEVEGERIDSKLDATVHLLDSSGRELGESRDQQGADPILDATIPADGRYLIKVHDVVYRGSNSSVYRLTLTDGPHIDAVVPNTVAPGESRTVTLIGRNLGGTPLANVLIDGQPVEEKQVTLLAPTATDPDPACPSRSFVPSFSASRRGFEYALESPSGRSNRVFIAESTDPVAVEQEPNDDGEHAQTVTPPCVISGAFNVPGDQDLYRFRAKKGEIFWIDASAERIGSAADPSFQIQKVNEKGETQDLVSGDDLPDRSPVQRFPMASVDASTRWTAPDDGLYQVVISDLFASQRGDPRLAYQLTIGPERPDFALFVLPDSPDQPDALTLPAGGRALAYVQANRIHGFNGAIHVEPVELPGGVHCKPTTIPAGQTLAPLVFEADANAAHGHGAIRLIGRARFGDRKDALGYVPGVTSLGPDVAHEALGGNVVWSPAGAQQGPPIPPARLTRGFVVKVTEPSPLNLQASPTTRTVTQGSLLSLDLTVTRDPALTEAVAISLASPIPGLDANAGATSIAKGTNTGAYHAVIPTGVQPGVYSLVLQGNGPFPFSKDPNAKTKPNVPVIAPANLVNLVVRPATAKISVNNKGGAIKAGGTLEIEVTVTGVAKEEPGPWPVSLVAPAGLKLTANSAMAEPGKALKLTIAAAADSPVGAAAGVAIRVTAPFRGEPLDNDAPLALTINK